MGSETCKDQSLEKLEIDIFLGLMMPLIQFFNIVLISKKLVEMFIEVFVENKNNDQTNPKMSFWFPSWMSSAEIVSV